MALRVERLLTVAGRWRLQSVAANTTPSAVMISRLVRRARRRRAHDRAHARPPMGFISAPQWLVRGEKNLVSWPLAGHSFRRRRWPLSHSPSTTAHRLRTPRRVCATSCRRILVGTCSWKGMPMRRAAWRPMPCSRRSARRRSTPCCSTSIPPWPGGPGWCSHGGGGWRKVKYARRAGSRSPGRSLAATRFVRPPSRGAGGKKKRLRASGHSVRFLFEQHSAPVGPSRGRRSDGRLARRSRSAVEFARDCAAGEIAAIRSIRPAWRRSSSARGTAGPWCNRRASWTRSLAAGLAERAALTTLAPVAPIPTPNHWDKARRKLGSVSELSDGARGRVAHAMPPLVVEAGNPLWRRTTPLPAEAVRPPLRRCLASPPPRACQARPTSTSRLAIRFEQGPAWPLWLSPSLAASSRQGLGRIASAPPAPATARLGPDRCSLLAPAHGRRGWAGPLADARQP